MNFDSFTNLVERAVNKAGSYLSLSNLSSYSPQKLTVIGAVLLLVITGVWFWVRMVRDSFQREYETMTEKTLWRTVTLLLFLPGALIYFFRVYNNLGFKQYLAHHVIAIMVTSVAVVVATSTYGTLWYFNQRAEAQATVESTYLPPVLDLDALSQASLLNRPKYGAPLSLSANAGRTDPFAPLPGQESSAVPLVTPSPSPSPSATPLPGQ